MHLMMHLFQAVKRMQIWRVRNKTIIYIDLNHTRYTPRVNHRHHNAETLIAYIFHKKIRYQQISMG